MSLRSGSTTARLPCAHRGSIGFCLGLLLGHAADQETAPGARHLDLPIVVPDPDADLAADMPRGIVPDQGQNPDAFSREAFGRPGEEGAGHGADRSACGEAEQHPFRSRKPQAVAGERLGLGVIAVGRVHDQAQPFALRHPGVQGRLREAGEPDLVLEAQSPARPASCQADQPVAAAFFCA